MNEELVGTLTDEEIQAWGLENLVDKGAPDNPIVDAMLRGEGRTDPRGRPIISYRQYLEMMASGQRLDNYMLVMQGPTGKGLVQASKFQKWFGEGFRPPELLAQAEKAATKLTEKQAMVAERDRPTVVGKDQVQIYPCRDKYPECPRFFDTPKARQTHYGLEHERKWKASKEK